MANNTTTQCPRCSGDGCQPHSVAACLGCGGRGYVLAGDDNSQAVNEKSQSTDTENWLRQIINKPGTANMQAKLRTAIWLHAQSDMKGPNDEPFKSLCDAYASETTRVGLTERQDLSTSIQPWMCAAARDIAGEWEFAGFRDKDGEAEIARIIARHAPKPSV